MLKVLRLIPRMRAASGGALGAAQDELNVAFLQVFQGILLVGEDLELPLALGNKTGQMLRLDDVAVFQNDDSFDGVLQFPDVAGPGITAQQLECGVEIPLISRSAFWLYLRRKCSARRGMSPPVPGAAAD